MSSDVPTTDFSALLNDSRDALLAELRELGFGAEGETGLSYDANFADSSQVTAERGETDVLVLGLRAALHEIEKALERLGEGTYGICERCGQPIAVARLEAMPATTTCIACASLQR